MCLVPEVGSHNKAALRLLQGISELSEEFRLSVVE